MSGLSDVIVEKLNTLLKQKDVGTFFEENVSLVSTDANNKSKKDTTKSPRDRMKAVRQMGKQNNPTEHDVNTVESHQIPHKLLLALKHDNWVIRLKALHTLSHYPTELVLPLIQEATEDADWEIRAAAIKYLAKLSKNTKYLPVFLGALTDSEYTVIDAATVALKNYGSEAIDGLIERLNTERIETLGAAIEILGHIGDDSVSEHLKPFLTDKRTLWLDDRTLAQLAAEALVRIGSTQALDYVKESEGTGYIGDSPISALKSQSTPKDAETEKNTTTPSEKVTDLLQSVHSDEWESSQKAARDLREYTKKIRKQKNPEVCLQLTEALTDTMWTVRWTAAEALAWLADKTAIPHLEATLNDKNWMVRVAAINALVELNAQDSLPRLAELLSDEHQSVREASVEAMSLLGKTKAVTYLKKALNDDDAFVRLAAVNAISKLEDNIVIAVLPKTLEDEYSHVRWFAIKRLVKIKDARLLKYFTARLYDKDGPGWENLSIADYAIQGLENIGTAQSQKILGEWEKQSRNIGSDAKS